MLSVMNLWDSETVLFAFIVLAVLLACLMALKGSALGLATRMLWAALFIMVAVLAVMTHAGVEL